MPQRQELVLMTTCNNIVFYAHKVACVNIQLSIIIIIIYIHKMSCTIITCMILQYTHKSACTL